MSPAPPLTPAQLDRQLELDRALSCTRLKSTWENIFAKYGKNTDDTADIIDTRTGELIVDNGHLRALPDEVEGGWGDVENMKRKRGDSPEEDAGKGKKRRAVEEPECDCDELLGERCIHRQGLLQLQLDEDEADDDQTTQPTTVSPATEKPAEERLDVPAPLSSPNGASSPLIRHAREKKTPKALKKATASPVEMSEQTEKQLSPKSAQNMGMDDELDELSMPAPTPSRKSGLAQGFTLATPLKKWKGSLDSPLLARKNSPPKTQATPKPSSKAAKVAAKTAAPKPTKTPAKPTPTPASAPKGAATRSTATPVTPAQKLGKTPKAAATRPTATPTLSTKRTTPARRASTSSSTSSALPPPPPPPAHPVSTPQPGKRRNIVPESPFKSPRSITKTYKTPKTPVAPRPSTSSTSTVDPWAAPPPSQNPFYDEQWDDEHPDGRPPRFPTPPMHPLVAEYMTPAPKKRRSLGNFLTPAPPKVNHNLPKASKSVGGSVKRQKAKVVGKMLPPPTPRRGLLDFLAEREKKQEDAGSGAGDVEPAKAATEKLEDRTPVIAQKETVRKETILAKPAQQETVEKDSAQDSTKSPVKSSAKSAEKDRIEGMAEKEDILIVGSPPEAVDTPTSDANAPSGLSTTTPTPDVQKALNLPTPVAEESNLPAEVTTAEKAGGKCGTKGYRCSKMFCFQCSGLEGEEDDL